jgi:hypothetical protein
MLFNEYFVALKITSPKVIFITYLPDLIRVDVSSLFNINRSTHFVDSAISSLVMWEDLMKLIMLEFFNDVIQFLFFTAFHVVLIHLLYFFDVKFSSSAEFKIGHVIEPWVLIIIILNNPCFELCQAFFHLWS